MKTKDFEELMKELKSIRLVERGRGKEIGRYYNRPLEWYTHKLSYEDFEKWGEIINKLEWMLYDQKRGEWKEKQKK